MRKDGKHHEPNLISTKQFFLLTVTAEEAIYLFGFCGQIWPLLALFL
jgi:hypothetical protein